MRKISIFAALLITATVVLSSCGGPKTPAGTTEKFFNSIFDGDYEAAYNLCLFEHESKRDSLMSYLNEAVKENRFDKETLKENSEGVEVEVISVKDDSDSAVVELSLSDKKAPKRNKDKKYEIEAFLKKMDDGKWLMEKIKVKSGGKEVKAYDFADDVFFSNTRAKISEETIIENGNYNEKKQGSTTTPSESPSKVVKNAINYIFEGDVDGYINVQYFDGDESQIKAGRQQALSRILKQYGSKEECKKEMQMNAGNFGDFKIFSEKLSEDEKSAVVRYKLYGICDAIDDSEEGAESILLRKDATGDWGIVGIGQLEKSLGNL